MTRVVDYFAGAGGFTLGAERFVMPYNGSGSGLTGRSLARPLGTVTAADRWAVVDGDRMRMLSIRELRAATVRSMLGSWEP